MTEQTNPPVEEQPVVEIVEQDVISETAPIEDIVEMSEENDQSILIEQLQQELAQLQFQVADYKDRFVRQQAEMENTRKRLQRDVEDAHKFALKNVALELLPVCDSMEMEQAAAQKEDTDLNALREGSSLIYKMLTGILEKVGIQTINPEGEKFNPDFHEALAMQPIENKEPNSIVFVQQKGYQLNGRLLRPARVIIAKAME